MQYGDQTRDSHRYGGDVYDVGALLSAAQGAGEEVLEAVVGDGGEMQDLAALTANEEDEGVQDLVGLTERGTWSLLVCLYGIVDHFHALTTLSFALMILALPEAGVSREEMLGAESQNMFDFYDNAKAGGDCDAGNDGEDSDASVGDPGQFVLPPRSIQLAGDEPTEAEREVFTGSSNTCPKRERTTASYCRPLLALF